MFFIAEIQNAIHRIFAKQKKSSLGNKLFTRAQFCVMHDQCTLYTFDQLIKLPRAYSKFDNLMIP